MSSETKMVNTVNAVHDGKLECNTVEYKTAFLNSYLLYFLWQAINTSYATLSSGTLWNIPRVTCVFSVYTRAFNATCARRVMRRLVNTVEHTTAFMYSDWLYFLWHGMIKINIHSKFMNTTTMISCRRVAWREFTIV